MVRLLDSKVRQESIYQPGDEIKEATLDFLIKDSIKWWGLDKINRLFSPSAVIKIIKIDFSAEAFDDKLVREPDRMVDTM